MFLRVPAGLAVLVLAVGCVALGELRHPARPCGVAVADGSDTQE